MRWNDEGNAVAKSWTQLFLVPVKSKLCGGLWAPMRKFHQVEMKVQMNAHKYNLMVLAYTSRSGWADRKRFMGWLMAQRRERRMSANAVCSSPQFNNVIMQFGVCLCARVFNRTKSKIGSGNGNRKRCIVFYFCIYGIEFNCMDFSTDSLMFNVLKCRKWTYCCRQIHFTTEFKSNLFSHCSPSYKGTKLQRKRVATTLNRISQINLFLAFSLDCLLTRFFEIRTKIKAFCWISFRKNRNFRIRTVNFTCGSEISRAISFWWDGSSLLYRSQRSISCLQLNEMRLMCRRKKWHRDEPIIIFPLLSVRPASQWILLWRHKHTQWFRYQDSWRQFLFCEEREREKKKIEKGTVLEINIYCWLYVEAIGPKAIAAVIKTNSHFFLVFQLKQSSTKDTALSLFAFDTVNANVKRSERDSLHACTQLLHPTSHLAANGVGCVCVCWRRLKIESITDFIALYRENFLMFTCASNMHRVAVQRQTKGISREEKGEVISRHRFFLLVGVLPFVVAIIQDLNTRKANTANNGDGKESGKAWERDASSNQNWKEWKKKQNREMKKA